MKPPIGVEIDCEIGACYVRYSHAPVVRTCAVLPSAVAAADLDADGGIVGIEILRTRDRAVVALAQHFARRRGLKFPAHVSGELVVDSTDVAAGTRNTLA